MASTNSFQNFEYSSESVSGQDEQDDYQMAEHFISSKIVAGAVGLVKLF